MHCCLRNIKSDVHVQLAAIMFKGNFQLKSPYSHGHLANFDTLQHSKSIYHA